MNKTKVTVSNLTFDQVVDAGYRYRGNPQVDSNCFLGFKFNGRVFKDLKTLKSFLGVKNLKEIEFEADRLEAGSITAEFKNIEEGYLWAAYLWEGAFRVGTSADRLVLG
jgi:hypothetical protein